ncbi:MAG: hypothetical protein ACR2GD_05780 [Pyrinomonadaceae bacterium]
MSEIKQIDPQNWTKFLREFSARNNNRRARFQIFKGSQAQEEGQEAHLEEVSLKDEAGAKTVIVTRIDRTNGDGEKIHDTISDVLGVAVQYDTDGSEEALEITDKENELIMLRFESRVDGVS